MSITNQKCFIAGKWKVHPGKSKITKSEKGKQLEPKLMELLLYFCENRDRVVGKDELIQQVWKNQIITDNTIAQAISKLRKVLGDDPSNPEYIETIPKKGYQFIAKVSTGNSGDISKSSDKKSSVFETQYLIRKSLPLGIGMLFIVLVLITIYSVTQSGDNTSEWTPNGMPVTTLQGVESDPAISSDGKKLAYAWMNPEKGTQNIFVKIIDDPSSTLQLTKSADKDSSPAWSPDGDQIAFMRHNAGKCWIFMISSFGGRADKLTSCGQNRYADLSWSPNGKWLAYNDQTENGSFGIVLVNAENGKKKFLTNPSPTYWGDYDPVFSPDGSSVVFSRAFSEGMQDIFITDTKGKEIHRLTYENKNIFGISWASNEHLIYASNRFGTYDLWSLSLKDADIKSVYKNDRNIINPVINKEGRIVYESRNYDMNIWEYAFKDNASQPFKSLPIINSTRWELYPSVSPDRQSLAFISNRSGTYELWISSADGTNAGKLTTLEGPFISNPDWSPDNSKIVFDARLDGRANIYYINSSGGNPIAIIESRYNDLVPRWSKDGKWIYFASDRTGQWQIWKKSINGNRLQQVTQDGGFAVQESSNGDTLFFSKPNEFGIWSKTSDNKEILEVKELDPGDWGNWRVTKRGIYFVNRGSAGSPVISFKNFATGEIRTILEPKHGLPIHDAAFTVIPEKKRILLGKRGKYDSDLMSIRLPSSHLQ